MTSGTIPVSAQWALEGKQLDGEGFRILACSTGDLDRENFADALSRFRVGELSQLPQVSLSYARRGAQPGQSYLALAIHWYATEGEHYADEVVPRDSQGRATAYTSYFCLPYKHLAPAGIGYVAMYDALRAVRLAVADGPPKDVSVALPASRTPTADDLAVRVAPLLLAGRRVCVLGAEGTSMLERLEFIDTVMQLLPYGFRSRMTAATWMRAVNRNHGFRLFFSSAPRADGTDQVVMWDGDPGLVRVSDREAGEYLDWLQDNLGPLARLAELNSEMGFSRKDTLQAVESVLGARHRFQSRPRPVAPVSNGRPGEPRPDQSDDGEVVLRRCADHAKLGNPTRLRSDIRFLRKFADGGIEADRRKKYQDLIARFGLLRHDFLLDVKDAERLCDALLRLAFGIPLSYEAYCRVETCAGIAHGDAPHKELLVAIDKAGMADSIVRAIVYWHLRQTDGKKLNKFIADEADPVKLICRVAGNWTYLQHATILCDVTLEYLAKERGRYSPLRVREVLCQQGFLARALQLRHPYNDQYQVDVLTQFLKAAYPQPANTPGQDLSRPAIVQILNRPGAPSPTPALLSAVLMLVDKPGSWQLAWNAYIRGSLTQSQFDGQTLARLGNRLPSIDAAAINAPEPTPENDPARPAGAGAGAGSWPDGAG